MAGAAASRTGDETGPSTGEAARNPDFSGHTTHELERARRELTASAALAVPGWGAHEVAVRQAQAIDAELAARVRRSPFDVDQGRALEALRTTWGDEYDTGFADDAWWAKRLDGTGEPLTGETPDELAAAICADWGARNMPGRTQ